MPSTFNDPEIEKEFRAMLVIRLSALNEACSAICAECKRGDFPHELNDVISANGRPYWHELLHSDGTKSDTFEVCAAANIRKLME